MKRISQSARDLVTLIVSLLVLVITTPVFGLPLAFSFLLAVLVLGGLYFLLNPGTAWDWGTRGRVGDPAYSSGRDKSQIPRLLSEGKTGETGEHGEGPAATKAQRPR
jgi:hypothetical protein